MRKTNFCRIRYLLVGGGVFLFIGIFIGKALPFQLFPLLIQNVDTQESISIPEAINSVVGVIQSILTFGVFLVALFGEPLKKFFKSPKLRIELDENFQENLEDPRAKIKTAAKYSRFISVHNDGNASADLCEVTLERIQFYPPSNNGSKPSPTLILSEEQQVSWLNYHYHEPRIASKSRKRFCCVELFAPDNATQPGGIPPREPKAKLVIAGFEVPEEYIGGTWEADISVISSSDKAYSKQLVITWDGAWQDRLVDLKGFEVGLKDL